MSIKKVKVVFAADFKILNTGIYTTASKLTNENISLFEFYSEQLFSINGVKTKRLDEFSELKNNEKIIVFTHLEYSKLAFLQRKFTNAYYHVGDWPGNYWLSMIKNKNFLRGLYGFIRFNFRLLFLDKKSKYIFVSHDDCQSAINSAFKYAIHLPIGINTPNVNFSKSLCLDKLVFTGNFAYKPNMDAALELIEFINRERKYTLYLAGFNSHLLNEHFSEKIIEVGTVDSIIDYLTNNRMIYVSLIRIGAGSKNKILEAVVSGLPIICTKESLDSSTKNLNTLKIVKDNNDIVNKIIELKNNKDLNEEIINLSIKISQERSWYNVYNKLYKLLSKNV